MSIEEAKKLFAEGLAKLGEGFDRLCESGEDLEPEATEDTGFRPKTDLVKQLRESLDKHKLPEVK